MKNLLILCSILIAALLSAPAFAHDGHDEIPPTVPKTHWSCKDLGDLAGKYGVDRLPEKGTYQRTELAFSLLSLLEKVAEKCEREGRDSVPPEDLERVSALHEALKEDLARYEGYQVRREAIERMLAKPEQPPFQYKAGVAGFVRGEGTRNFRLTDFSFSSGHGEGRFLYRVKPYAYWHPAEWLDIHTEGQGYGFKGGSHQEYNKVSLYQGFVEARVPGTELVALKAGRQEFSYGSAFILGPEAFYDGLSFDSIRLRTKPVDSLTIDILGGSYATPFSNGLRGNLAGAYATYALAEGTAIEAYAFRDSGSVNHHPGEYVATYGLRTTTKAGPLSLELEPVYQSGRSFNTFTAANDRIEAYGGHLDVASEVQLGGYNNKFLVSYGYGSGSRNAANGATAAREFRNPNNDNSLTGDMNVIGDFSGVTVEGHHASGLQAYTLGWGIDFSKDLNFSATGRYFRANAAEDNFSKDLGLETDFTLTYAMSDKLSLIAGYDRFFTGGFFRDASGSNRNIDYGYLMLQFDISHIKPKMKKV